MKQIGGIMDSVARVCNKTYRRSGDHELIYWYEAPNSVNRTPENVRVCLWRSVIQRAIEDSIGANMTCGDYRDLTAIINEARYVLSKPSRWLSELCDLADLNMDYLIKHCRGLWE